MERRGFLKLLGLGGVASAFAGAFTLPPAIDWATAVPTIGTFRAAGTIPLSLEWMTLQCARALEHSLGASFVHPRGEYYVGSEFPHQFNAYFAPETVLGTVVEADEMIGRWLAPCGRALAQRVKVMGPVAFADLALPHGVDGAARVVGPSGVSVRGVSHMLSTWELQRQEGGPLVSDGQGAGPLAIRRDFDLIQCVRFDVLVG